MKFKEQLTRIKALSGIRESVANTVTAYHGTVSPLPFQSFHPGNIGSGIVSGGGGRNKYGGFFFTSEFQNAEFYTEWFVAKVQISDVHPNPLSDKHSPTVMRQASADNKIYWIEDYHDGAMSSDITVVPSPKVGNIHILEWICVAEEEDLFEKYDEFFNLGDDSYEEEDEDGVLQVYDNEVTQDSIKDTLRMIELDLNYLLTIPVFKKYYDSKQ